MRKILLLIVFFVVVEFFYSSIVKAQEEPACWSVTASVLNERSGPGIEYSVVGSLVYGTTITGQSNGMGWIQRDIGTWLSQSYLTSCTATVRPSETQAAINNPPTSAIETFGGIVIVNRPAWLDGNDVVRLYSIEAQYIPHGVLSCADQPIVVYFGTQADADRMAGYHIDYIEGYYDLSQWDGTYLRYFRSGDCSQFVHGIFILQGMDTYTTWQSLGHEISHKFGAMHGTNSPSWVNSDPIYTGLQDAYWVGNEVRKASRSDCGQTPTEFCIAVYNAVFAS